MSSRTNTTNTWLTALVLLALAGWASAEDLRPAERTALDAFDRELTDHVLAVRGGKAFANPDRMLKAARDRRVVLSRLVREDPEQAVAVALDRIRRKQVPPVAAGELEQEVSSMGELEVVATTPEDFQQVPSIQRWAVINGQRYEVSTWGTGLGDHYAQRRSLQGITLDGVLALVPGRLRVLKPGEPISPGKRLSDQRCSVSGKLAGANQEPSDGLNDVIVESGDAVHYLCQSGHILQLGDQVAAAEGGSGILASAWTTGPKKVLYMIARFADETGFPETLSIANSRMTEVANYFQATSWGQTTMTWEAIEIVLPKNKADYSPEANRPYILMADARAAAAALDPQYASANWDLDAVRFNVAYSGGWLGQGIQGGKGVWIQNNIPGVAIHEFGHNYGLAHANFWNTSDTSVIGAGVDQGYGDPFSTMGASTKLGQFSPYEKWLLGWIPTSNIQTITSSGTYRVYTADSATAPSGTSMYGLRITKDSERDYWISHRRQFASTNKWAQDGVFLHWDPWNIPGVGSAGGTQLLDTTPGTAQGKNDAPLVRGRTFSDTAANIHITPMTLNTGTIPISMDVVVKMGPFPGNRVPTVSLTANLTSVAPGANVSFTATAADADGDALAVYWDFGDESFASNTLTITKTLSSTRVYPVRVIVSDMKGGTASATVLVTVGTESTFRISGRVRTSGGAGVEGVRVHTGTNAGSVWTNSDGSYSLVNLSAGNYTVAAQSDDYVFTSNFANPVAVGPNAVGRDFTLVNTNVAPTVASAASATPNPVIGTTTALSVLGADDGGEPALTYTWATTGTPPASVVFSATGTNAAKNVTATFSKAGSYTLQATIKDAGNLTVTSSVTVTVNQTNTTVSVTPTIPAVHVGSTQTFAASGKDQFGTTLPTQPTFTWSVTGGKIISSSGVVSVSTTTGGPYTVTATGGGKSGTTTFTVVNDIPTISAIADQSTAVDTATSAIAFTISDTETSAAVLTISKVSSDTVVVPTANIVLGGSGASRTVTITPAAGKTGTVNITLTVADANGGSQTETFILYAGVAPPPSGSGSGGGGGGGGGGCGLGAGVSALLVMFGLMFQRLMGRRRQDEHVH